MWKIKRSVVEIAALTLWVSLSFLLPLNDWQQTPQLKLLALMIQKGLPISLGILIAHVSRNFLFPYMNLQGMLKEHHWSGVIFLSIWYGVIVWAFASGG
jgi:hypothetical protein